MKKMYLFLLFVGINTMVFSQKIVKESGNLDFLKGQKEINIEYDYTDMAVGKYKSEEAYLADKSEERNKKEAGSGDEWKEKWVSSRDRVYHPKFEELINKGLEKAGITVTQNNEGAQYKLIVKTTFTEPGFNIGITKRPSAINVEYIFVDQESGEVLAKYSQKGIPGSQAMGMDYDTSTRISESYAKAGKMLAGYMHKQLK